MNSRLMILLITMLLVFIPLSYFYYDIPIALYFHALKDTKIVYFASMLTYFGEGVYYILPSLFLFLYWRHTNPFYGKIAFFILVSTSVSGIAVNLLKIFFARFRPEIYFTEHMYGFNWFHIDTSMASFPSGHSTTAMGAWFAFSLLLPKYRYLLLTIGTLIVSTRVIVTEHYFSDAIAGSFLGIVITLIAHHLIFIKKEEPLRAY